MNQQMIDRLRQYYDLPSTVSDADISKRLETSYGHALIKLSVACEKFGDAIKASFLSRNKE